MSCLLDRFQVDVELTLYPPFADTQLKELELPEAPVLELLNAVSIAKRMANMVRFFLPLFLAALTFETQALHSEGFGNKQENNKKKNATMGGKSAPKETKGRVWKNKPVAGGAAGRAASEREAKRPKV